MAKDWSREFDDHPRRNELISRAEAKLLNDPRTNPILAEILERR
jgi:hypothetical protein